MKMLAVRDTSAVRARRKSDPPEYSTLGRYRFSDFDARHRAPRGNPEKIKLKSPANLTQ
jgi:hypothetical protein